MSRTAEQSATRAVRQALDRPGIANPALPVCRGTVIALLALAPLFLVFEVWQLVLCERYLGIKQIERGADPRQLGLREITAFFWSLIILGYWAWMLLLLLLPAARVHAMGLLLISMVGFSLRRGVRFKWLLVILTLEGAIRIGLLLSVCSQAWRRLT